MDKLTFGRAVVQGESFKAIMERKDPFFQQIQSPKEARFQLVSFLNKSCLNTSGEGIAGSSSSPKAESKEKKQQEEVSQILSRQREEIMAEARQEARKIKEEAYRQGLDEGLAQGKAQGLAEGREEGQNGARKELMARLLPLEDTLRNLIRQVEQVQEDILSKQEHEILQLCTKMAQKIVHTEISQNPALILANLREGLKFIGHHKVVAIKLNPRDLDLVRNRQEEISQSMLNLDGVTLEADPALLAGGCLIQTDLGQVDATIETQLGELEKTFKDR
jgi:flagellar assembly protein FliH